LDKGLAKFMERTEYLFVEAEQRLRSKKPSSKIKWHPYTI